MKIRCFETGPGCDGRFEIGQSYEFDIANQGIYDNGVLIFSFPFYFDSIEDWNKKDQSQLMQIAKFKEVYTVLTKEQAIAERVEQEKLLKKAMKMLEEQTKKFEAAKEAELIAVKYDRWPNLIDEVMYFAPELINGVFVPTEKKFSMSAWVENENYVNWTFVKIEDCQRQCDMLNFHGTTRRMALQIDGHLGYGFDTTKECYTLYMDMESKELSVARVDDFATQQPLVTLMTREAAETLVAVSELIETAKVAWNG